MGSQHDAASQLPIKLLTVASPTYLAAHGTPTTLADLTQTNPVGFCLFKRHRRQAIAIWLSGRSSAITPIRPLHQAVTQRRRMGKSASCCR